MDYDNSNSGALFKNDKEGNDLRPDYKGTLNVGGVKYKVSSWIQTAKGSGQKFMSLKVEKDLGPGAKPAPKQQETVAADEDIPF